MIRKISTYYISKIGTHIAATRVLRSCVVVLVALFAISMSVNTFGHRPMPPAAPGWETISSSTADLGDSDRIDVVVKDGYIYITTNHVVNVKIFSILGQLISQKTLQPGTSRLRVPARGIYILKAGTYTRRVTV